MIGHRPPGRRPAALIELAGVTKTHGSGEGAFESLRGVSLAIGRGERVAIIGPSGSGKSTLLHMIAGIDVPSRGEVRLGGSSLASLSDEQLSLLRLNEIGFVFQGFHLFPALTAGENVGWPLELAGVPRAAIRSAVRGALEQVGMSGREARRPGELSGGEQQRVAIARALVNRPSILLADEPTGNLDTATGETILDLLGTLNRRHDLTVVMVTHMLAAAEWSDRAIELRDGAVVSDVRRAAPASSLS
ncbi:MAG TPA: ABC transporter ATP-binding protein [Candidatus Bathyarchaeia archaeon]|nr:ABC transporter ATP-binding protein [Candidatus Bathyarchaeia archaeon]